MAEAAAVAAENNDHRICCFERCIFVQNLLLLLLSLLPGCPGSCILLLLLTERHSFKIGFHFILNNWQCRRLLTEHTAGSIGGRRCSQGQGWDKARWSNYVWCQICKVWSPCSSSRWPCSCSWWWRGSSGPASSWCSSPWGLTRPTCIRPITIATITMVSHTNVPDTAGAPGWLGAVPGQADTWEERVILMASIGQRIIRKELCVKALD